EENLVEALFQLLLLREPDGTDLQANQVPCTNLLDYPKTCIFAATVDAHHPHAIEFTSGAECNERLWDQGLNRQHHIVRRFWSRRGWVLAATITVAQVTHAG